MISNTKFRDKLIIFDCDGVLIDSEIIGAKVELRIANELGHPITLNELIERFVGRPTRHVWETILSEIGIPFSEDFFHYTHQEIHKAFDKDLQSIKGVEDTLKFLSNELEMKLCVASTTRLDNLRRNLQRVNLDRFLEPNIFSASQVERPKPFPDVYLFAAKSMGFHSRNCLVFEDSLPGAEAAIAADMKTIGFCGGGHILENHESKLRAKGVFDVINGFEEIIPNLENWLSA